MERIPILKLGEILLVTIQVDFHDRSALALQEDLTQKIVDYSSKGVLIDISALEMVDSFMGRVLGNIAKTSRLLDCNTVLVGMQPAIAITITELGITLKGIHTALTAEDGIELLNTLIQNGNNGQSKVFGKRRLYL
ncbi:MAG: STAS domain-containing protein [Candidatus Obscuribacter sp.]|jgi:rsbT antagonist protein RsbS|nr:STAS domain-containing protein [Candidatus Obscuribacter sp.]MBK7838215.1 STAS domain-containing protein [Candidatus Obscuribacter sp.]MBK9201275.1 STAS domain-containing protein [Candidatus Obscuribacter sp.]MBK9621925.1 STAS domain-containing protein [Candidatus Obscuribacter sp.]MBK9773978.1 STAS domain-containing protein [Candidatus Obscuribacter sp.]